MIKIKKVSNKLDEIYADIFEKSFMKRKGFKETGKNCSGVSRLVNSQINNNLNFLSLQYFGRSMLIFILFLNVEL